MAQLCTASSLGLGARAIGMGGAYTAVADDGAAAYWNPAGITQVNMGLVLNGGVQGNMEMMDAVNNQDPDALDGSFGLVGGAGLTFEKLAFNFFTDLQVAGVGDGAEKAIRVNGAKQGALTFATECTELLAFGVNAKYLYLEEEMITMDGSAGKSNEHGFAVDLGGLIKVGKLVRVGAVLKDFSLTKMKGDLPTKLVLGGALKVPFFGMVVAADLETPLQGTEDPVFHVGLEQPILGVLFLRAGGYQGVDGFNFTAGGGLKLGPVLADVAMDLGAETPTFYATAGIKF